MLPPSPLMPEYPRAIANLRLLASSSDKGRLVSAWKPNAKLRAMAPSTIARARKQ